MALVHRDTDRSFRMYSHSTTTQITTRSGVITTPGGSETSCWWIKIIKPAAQSLGNEHDLPYQPPGADPMRAIGWGCDIR